MNIVRMGAGVLLAAFLVFMGIQKFGGPNPVFSYMAAQSGIELFEPAIRMFTGVAELGAAALILVGLFMGVARGVGALLSAGVIGGRSSSTSRPGSASTRPSPSPKMADTCSARCSSSWR